MSDLIHVEKNEDRFFRQKLNVRTYDLVSPSLQNTENEKTLFQQYNIHSNIEDIVVYSNIEDTVVIYKYVLGL